MTDHGEIRLSQITEGRVVHHWGPHLAYYLTAILKGEETLHNAREDILSLIESPKYSKGQPE